LKSYFDWRLNDSRSFPIGVSIQSGVVQPIGCPGANDPRGERVVCSGVGGAEKEIRLIYNPYSELALGFPIHDVSVGESVYHWEKLTVAWVERMRHEGNFFHARPPGSISDSTSMRAKSADIRQQSFIIYVIRAEKIP